jgi:hypothetical protein
VRRPALSHPTDTLDTDAFYPPRDRAGVKQLHRLELPAFLRAVPGVLAFFSNIVPAEFYAVRDDEGAPIIVVDCRCGERPVLRFGERAYSIAVCQCERMFMFDGKQLRSGRAGS